MQIQNLVDHVEEASGALASSANVVAATSNYTAALADLGAAVLEHYRNQSVIDHPIRLAGPESAVELLLVDEHTGAFYIALKDNPGIQVYFEAFDGEFNVRLYEGEGDDDAGRLIYSRSIDSGAPD